MAGPSGRSPRGVLGAGFAVGLAAALFGVVYLKSPSAWWFEDDPWQFARAAHLQHPADAFLDPSVLRGWGTGASLVPMHVLSYWADVRLFGLDPRPARIHNLVATVVVTVLVYAALLAFGAGVGASAAGALLWLAAPATLSVHENLGARQYLEGLGWALAACLALRRAVRCEGRRIAAAALYAAFAAAAMLSKEIYVPTLAAFAALYAGRHRRWLLAASGPAMALLYAAYRRVLLGAGAEYPHGAITTAGYARYVSILPYTLSASRWGAAVLLLLAVLAADAVRRNGRSAGRSLALFGTLLAAGLVAVYPTAPSVAISYETPGTWYRAVFVLSTLVIVAGAYLAGRHASRGLALLSLVAAAAIILPGTLRTRAYWRGRLAAAEDEGRFYLAHPARLVYSEEDADWFLPGLDRMYRVADPHAISKNRTAGDDVRERLERHATIWRRSDGVWREDPELYERLRRENVANR
jgi:hypothetical protein